MAKKAQDGEANKSQAIRDLLKEKPGIKASEAVAALLEKGITVTPSLFYMVKGNVAGRKSRRRKNKRKAVQLMTASANGDASGTTVAATSATQKSDALATIRKIKALAADVGGLRTLKALVDALSE